MFESIIGKFLITFGNLEQTIKTINNMLLCRFSSDESAKKMYKFILNRQSFSNQINILSFFIQEFLSGRNKENWIECLKSINKLSETRNLLAHNMYGVEEDKFIKMKVNKDGTYTEINYDRNEMEKFNEELNIRYRQLFDSIIENVDYFDNNYPKLFLS